MSTITSANTVSNIAGSDFPATGSPRQKLDHALKQVRSAATLNGHHAWQCQLNDQFVELSAPASPGSDIYDPDGRECLIRCGSALWQLKLVLKRFGCLGRVELFPDMSRTDLVARIYCGAGPACAPADSALFEALARKASKSSSWNEPEASESILQPFQSTGTVGEKAWLEFAQCGTSRDRLAALAESSPSRPAVAGYQVTPPESSRVAQWTKPLLTFVVRGGETKKMTFETGERRAGEMGVLAVIKTKTDDKHGWLATGEAFARIKLQARASEIASQIFDQAFQNRRVREVLRLSFGRKGFVQSVVGLGLRAAAWRSAELPVNGRMFEPGMDLPSRLRTD